MVFDARKNFAYSTVGTAPSPAISGTSLVVQTGDGAKFPTPPFNAVIWPAGTQPTTANAEIVRVTNIATDTLTITRAQESSSARTVIVGDQIAQVLTNKTLADIEALFPTGTVIGNTDSQTLSNKVLSDEFMGDVFDSQSALKRDVALLASTDFIALDALDVGSTGSLEIPATSSLEVVAYQPSPPMTAYLALFDFIESGCVWTPDAAGSTLLASMSEGFMWLGGRRLYVAAIKSRAFTANRDVYVDFKDNNDGTAVPIYTENTNNAATGAPSLSDRQIRNAIIVTGATSIAAASSINQGQESAVLPIVSSVPYTVTDNLGNLICPRDPQRKLLGYRQLTSLFSTTSLTAVQVTGLSVPFIPVANRKHKITLEAPYLSQNTSSSYVEPSVWDGPVGSGTKLQQWSFRAAIASQIVPFTGIAPPLTPTSNGLKTINAGLNCAISGTGSLEVYGGGGAVGAIFLKVELE